MALRMTSLRDLSDCTQVYRKAVVRLSAADVSLAKRG